MTTDTPRVHSESGEDAQRQRLREVDVLAEEAIDTTDGKALGTLRTVFEHLDSVPGGLADRICFAVALDEVWVEVAEITHIASRLVGTRSTARAQQFMTLSAEGVTVVIAVADDANNVRLDGWVTPDARWTCTLRTPRGVHETVVEHGRFSFADVPTGMVQLVLTDPAADGPLITSTLEL